MLNKQQLKGYFLAKRLVISDNDEYNILHYGIDKSTYFKIRELEWKILGMKQKKLTFQDIVNYKQIEKGI